MAADGTGTNRSTPGRILRFLSILGPGLTTGASDDDPSGIGTYAQAGAQLRPDPGAPLDGHDRRAVAVPVMVVMTLMTQRRDIMGDATVAGWLRGLGWASTAAMAACVAGMAASWFG